MVNNCKKSALFFITVLVSLLFLNCKVTTDIETGTVVGSAVYENASADDNAGIIIQLENSSLTPSASVLSQRSTTGVASYTMTASSGAFTLSDVPSGVYTLYAYSRDAAEGSVTKS